MKTGPTKNAPGRNSCSVIAGILFAVSPFIECPTADAQVEKTFAATYNGKNYEIVLYTTKDNTYQVSTCLDKTKKVDLLELERQYFRVTIDSLFADLSTNTDTSKLALTEVSDELFGKIERDLRNEVFRKRLETKDRGANVGTLHLTRDSVGAVSSNKQGPLWHYFFVDTTMTKRDGPQLYVDSFKVTSVEVSFEAGMATDLQISGTYNYTSPNRSREVQYRNTGPIPLGSPKEIDRFNGGRYLLFADLRGCPSEPGCGHFTSAIDPSTVLRFERHVIGAGTYVPRDTVVTMLPTDGSKDVSLEKHSFIRNFDTRIYSDVTGLNRNNPNGILQIEVKYEHVLNTTTLSVHKKTWRSSLLMHKLSPFVIFPKLQDKLSSLRVDTIQTLVQTEVNSTPTEEGTDVGAKSAVVSRNIDQLTATSIDVIRYANLHLGLGLHFFDYLHSRNRFSLGVEVGLFRTRVDSSSLSENGVSLSNVDSVSVDLSEASALFYYVAPRFSGTFVESRSFDFELLGSLMLWQPFGRIESDINMIGKSVMKIQANVNVHPAGSHEQSVFFRATLYKALGDLGGNHPSNLTLQIGYSTPISKIFGMN